MEKAVITIIYKRRDKSRELQAGLCSSTASQTLLHDAIRLDFTYAVLDRVQCADRAGPRFRLCDVQT